MSAERAQAARNPNMNNYPSLPQSDIDCPQIKVGFVVIDKTPVYRD